MGAFTQENTETFHDPSWEADEMVVIRKTLNVADQKVMTQSVRDAKQQGIEQDSEDMGMLVMERMLPRLLVDWTFKDNRGNKVALTPQTIDALPMEYGLAIQVKIGEIMEKWGAKQSPNFTTAPTPGMQENQALSLNALSSLS